MNIHPSKSQRLSGPQLPPGCDACPAARSGICSALTPSQLRHLSSAATRRRLPAGGEFLAASLPPESFANILSGVVKQSKLMADGRQQIVALQSAPDFIGWPFGAEGAVSIRAVTEVELCVFPRSMLEPLIHQNHRLEHLLHLQALAELDESRDLLLALGRKTARERVATFLLLVISRLRQPGTVASRDISIDLPLTRAEIADFLGLTFETVSRQLTALKRDGIIRLTGARKVVVADQTRLQAASGDERPH